MRWLPKALAVLCSWVGFAITLLKPVFARVSYYVPLARMAGLTAQFQNAYVVSTLQYSRENPDASIFTKMNQVVGNMLSWFLLDRTTPGQLFSNLIL